MRVVGFGFDIWSDVHARHEHVRHTNLFFSMHAGSECVRGVVTCERQVAYVGAYVTWWLKVKFRSKVKRVPSCFVFTHVCFALLVI